MNQKKLIILVAVIFSVFAVANVALAKDRVEVKVTSEPIMYGSECSKAGGFSLEFDSNTILKSGDRMTVDLDFIDNDTKVLLCNEIDFVVAPENSNVQFDTTTQTWTFDIGWGDQNTASLALPADGANEDGPFNYTTTQPQVPSPTSGVDVGDGIIFHVVGEKGTGRITITVLGNDTTADGGDTGSGASGFNNGIMVGPDQANDKLTLKIWDLALNGDFDVPGIYEPVDKDTTIIEYTEDIEIQDNALCIDPTNPNDWPRSVFKGNMDSRNDKYTFIPSDPQIAHYGPGRVEKVSCDKAQKCGNIEIGSGATQGTTSSEAATCDSFDNETGDGYCDGTHKFNRFVIESSQPFNSDGRYQLSVQILVNGTQSANQGVYFSNTPIGVGVFTSENNACENAATPIGGTTYYYYASGQTLNDAGETPEAPHANECDVDPDRKAVTLVTDPTGAAVVPGGNYKYMFVDLPPFNYDLDEISEGDQVTVNISITELPCTELFNGTHCIGTFGCGTVAPDTTRQLFFPYYTEMENGGYWDGFVIENVGAADGEATITVYEEDGDIGTATIPVDAHGMYVNLLSAMLPDMTMTDESDGDGTLGNSRCYMVVCTDFNADGFAMMGNSGTGESMGYLPRIAPTLPGTNGDSYPLCD